MAPNSAMPPAASARWSLPKPEGAVVVPVAPDRSSAAAEVTKVDIAHATVANVSSLATAGVVAARPLAHDTWWSAGSGALISAVLHAAVLFGLGQWMLFRELQHSKPLVLETTTAEEALEPQRLSALSSMPASLGRALPALPGVVVGRDAPLEVSAVELASGEAAGSFADPGWTNLLKEMASTPARYGPVAKFFGSVAYGQRFVYILDASGSMSEGQRYARAFAELVRSIDSLGGDHEFYVILFQDQAIPMFDQDPAQAKLLPATEENKARLKQWLAGASPDSWSDPRGALDLAISLEPSAIFLLSDGKFLTQAGSGEQMLGYVTLQQVRKQNKTKIPIHTIACEDAANARILRIMARASGGTYKYVRRGGITKGE